MADKDPKGWVPPYISFTSFTGLLDRMHADGGAPPQIDRSFLATFSGGYQSQVIAALKSLGLIDDKGTVTTRLTTLVEADDRKDREPVIAEMLREYYPEPVRLGGTRATQGQLEAAFREYGISGDTLRKAIAFYLGAAKYSGIPTSAHFRVPSVAPGDARKPRKQRPPADGQQRPETKTHEQEQQDESWLSSIDPAIVGWLRRIPATGEAWSKEDRERWKTVLDALFVGVYGE